MITLVRTIGGSGWQTYILDIDGVQYAYCEDHDYGTTAWSKYDGRIEDDGTPHWKVFKFILPFDKADLARSVKNFKIALLLQ